MWHSGKDKATVESAVETALQAAASPLPLSSVSPKGNEPDMNLFFLFTQRQGRGAHSETPPKINLLTRYNDTV